ncbi:DUF2294 domain-containing protein [bacterium]|nr:MAG: DUF2294 domain-containing protein [bacterium]
MPHSLEAIETAVRRFHREQQGHAPSDCLVTMNGDLLVVVTRDVFTPTEQALLEQPEGRKLVSTARRELRSLTRDVIEPEIARLARRPVVRSYYDLDVRVGEQIEVYVLGR